MTTLSPEVCEYLMALARRMDAAGHGGTTALVHDAAAFLDWSAQKVYRQLGRITGRNSGRKARSDKGSTCVSQEALVTLASAQREAIRDNGKQVLHTTVARGILEQNGLALGVSNGHLNRLMRQRHMSVAAQRHATPVQALRAPYPNHTHEVDPSLCLIYYMRDRQYIVRDREFYKNKLDGMAKVKFKVYRYVLYDRASGVIVPWYCEAIGEDQHNLFDFLMFAWGRQDGRLFHGVPRFLMWDKGSANQSAAIANLLKHLEVTPLDHMAGNARAKGGVENANNLVETQFESRLRFEPVADVAALNRAALSWANAYNANLVPGQDCRLRRPGLCMPMARLNLWQLIAASQIRNLPSVEVCRALMAAKEASRKVRPDMTVTFKHPDSDRSLIYSVKGLDGVTVGGVVQVRSLVYGECAIQLQVPRYDGEMRIYRIEPQQGYDRFGQLEAAAEIGAEYKSAPKTVAQMAADAMDTVAYPRMDADEVRAARNKKVAPFGGKLVAHGYLQDVRLPTYLPKAGSDIETPAHVNAAVPMLDSTQAMLRLAKGIGRYLSPQEHLFIAARYADGVPEDQIEALIAQFNTAEPAAEPMRAAGGLRLV